MNGYRQEEEEEAQQQEEEEEVNGFHRDQARFTCKEGCRAGCLRGIYVPACQLWKTRKYDGWTFFFFSPCLSLCSQPTFLDRVLTQAHPSKADDDGRVIANTNHYEANKINAPHITSIT